MPLSVLVGYLVGTIPFALLLAKRWGGADLRAVGSGNLGATNVMRASGLTPGLIVAALDVSKGMASVLIAERLVANPASAAASAAGLAAIVGHIYPVWLGFRGGKGVATACGVFAVLAPMAAVAALAVFVASVWLTKYISVGSVLGSAALPPAAYLSGEAASVVTAGVAAASLIVFRHRSNLARLRAGTERRFARTRGK